MNFVPEELSNNASKTVSVMCALVSSRLSRKVTVFSFPPIKNGVMKMSLSCIGENVTVCLPVVLKIWLCRDPLQEFLDVLLRPSRLEL